jgi:nucleoside-diphosphate-sugar epimerase
LDDFSTGRLENLEPFLHEIELVEGDVRKTEVVRKAVADIDYVLHEAAALPHSDGGNDPISLYETNVGGTTNLLFASHEAGVRRLVYASSYLVYGERPWLESSEPHPGSAYAESKLSGEQACQSFAYGQGLYTVCLRYFSVFGPRQASESPYSATTTESIEGILQGGPLQRASNKAHQDLTYVSDVIEASLLATVASKAIPGRVYNVGSGCRYSRADVVACLNGDWTIDQVGKTGRVSPSIQRAHAALQYRPKVGLAEGLDYLVQWHRKHRAFERETTD